MDKQAEQSIPITEIRQILAEKNINHLYHANSVKTSLLFLRNGGLMSRGLVEKLGLLFFQTPQGSDGLDKQYGIWNDIFFDSVDIHARAKDVNVYGPVLFEYKADAILDLAQQAGLTIKITKDNPTRWKPTQPEEDRYFTTAQDLRDGYHRGDFGKHLTICGMDQILPFATGLLEEILLDDYSNVWPSDFNKARHRILTAMQTCHLPASLLEIRSCHEECWCQESMRTGKMHGKHENRVRRERYIA